MRQQPVAWLRIEHPDFVWIPIASMYLGNIAGLIVVLSRVPLFAAILRIPFSIIAPMVLVACAVGAYTVHSSMVDVSMMLLFGIVGYFFKKLDYPIAPLLLALVLGGRAEDAFRQSMLGSRGSLDVFWSSGLVGSITTLALVILVWPLLSRGLERWRQCVGVVGSRC
jgi:putative tricarboxylic transport membrane protein